MVQWKYRLLKSLNLSIAWRAPNIFPITQKGHHSFFSIGPSRQREVHTVNTIIKIKLLNRGKQKPFILKKGEQFRKGYTQLPICIPTYITCIISCIISYQNREIHQKHAHQSSTYVCITLYKIKISRIPMHILNIPSNRIHAYISSIIPCIILLPCRTKYQT